jgi:hypothetical protein
MKQGGIYHHRENQGNHMGRAGLEAPVAVPKAEAFSLSFALSLWQACNVVDGNELNMHIDRVKASASLYRRPSRLKRERILFYFIFYFSCGINKA